MSQAPIITIREAVRKDIPLVLDFIRRKAAFDGVPQRVEATKEMLESELFGPRPVAFVLFAEVECPGRWLRDLLPHLLVISGSARHLAGRFVCGREASVPGSGQGDAGSILQSSLTSGDTPAFEWVAAEKNVKGLAFYQRSGARLIRVLRLDRAALARFADRGNDR